MSPAPPPYSHRVYSDGVAVPPLVVTRISGILEKWVNCGKGWKPRWFVLQDGVLSYYKVNNIDKIIVHPKENDKGCRVIGSCSPHHRKPLGELHLKVSSIRESRTDDRRFSIFTGTTRLHLRANNPEDQMEWMEALKTVKKMFPRMSNREMMKTMSSEITMVSTELLRARLSKEGLNEEIIRDAEWIMKAEFAGMQNQLALVQKKLRHLVNRAYVL